MRYGFSFANVTIKFLTYKERKKKMKRIISLFVLVTMLAGLLPVSSGVVAAEVLTNKEPVYLGTEAEYKTLWIPCLMKTVYVR